MELTVEKIESEEFVRKANQKAKNEGSPWKLVNLIVHEQKTGKTFENMGCINGNPWDLWLIKQNTFGKTYKTFKRICVGKDENKAVEVAKRIGDID